MVNKVSTASSAVHSLEEVLMRWRQNSINMSNRADLERKWQSMLDCVHALLHPTSVYSSSHQCIFSFMPHSSKCVCVSDRNRNKKGERGSAKRWLQTHTHSHTRGSLVHFYFFFLTLPLRRFVCAPLHANTHRERHNYFTLYPPQYEITAYRHVLQCTLVMKVNAGWRGIRGREYGGKRCKKNLLGLYHYGIFIPKTYYDVCSMITCCGVWIYLPMCGCVICVCF